MISQIVVAVAVVGSLFSMSAMATELNEVDDKKRRSGKCATRSWEPVVNIHNTEVVQAHPLSVPSGEESIGKLQHLRVQGERREAALRAWYQARGKSYPERFYGD